VQEPLPRRALPRVDRREIAAWSLAAGYTAASVAARYAAIHLATALVRRVRVRA
jgi:hypothetical protein